MSVRDRYASIDDRANISCVAKVSVEVPLKSVLLTPKPTRVAIDELQLHDLQKADAAVPPVKPKSAKSKGNDYNHIPMKRKQPEHSELPMAPTPPLRSGMERRAPILQLIRAETSLVYKR